MFKIITTEWIYNPHPLMNQRQRFVGPLWVAWLIIKTDGYKIHPTIGRIAGWLFKVSGAHTEIQDL